MDITNELNSALKNSLVNKIFSIKPLQKKFNIIKTIGENKNKLNINIKM